MNGMTTADEVPPRIAPSMQDSINENPAMKCMTTIQIPVMRTKLSAVIAIVPLMDFFRVSMVMCSPPSNRMIASVTWVKSGPTTPKAEGETRPMNGPMMIPMAIRKSTSGILVSVKSRERILPRKIRRPRKSTVTAASIGYTIERNLRYRFLTTIFVKRIL